MMDLAFRSAKIGEVEAVRPYSTLSKDKIPS